MDKPNNSNTAGDQEREKIDSKGKRTEEAIDPFKKKKGLARTPPTRERAHSLSELRVNLGRPPWEEEEMEKDKRKRAASKESEEEVYAEVRERIEVIDSRPETSRPMKRKKETADHIDAGKMKAKEMGDDGFPDEVIIGREEWDTLKHSLEAIAETVKDLKKLVKENVNTKVEIKKKITSLDQQMNRAGRKCREAESTMKECCENNAKKSMTMNACTQVNLDELVCELKEEDARRAEFVTRNLKEGRGFGDLGKILDIQWTEEIFQRVKVETWDIAKITANTDVAILYGEGKEEGSVMSREIAQRYPEVPEFFNRSEEKEEIDYVTVTTRLSSRMGSSREDVKCFYLITNGKNGGSSNDIENLYELIKRHKNMITNSGRRKVVFTAPGGIDNEYVRKTIEYVYRQTEGLEIKLLVPRATIKAKTTMRKAQDEVIIVKTAGEETFAELVKRVKTQVDVDKLGVHIKAIKKTGGGDLLLRVDGNREKAGVLKEEIQKKLGKSNVTLKNRVATVFITDVDASTSAEEVRAAIHKIMGGNDGVIEVKSLKPSRDGNQVAAVQVGLRTGRELVKRGNIKIGWVNCRIREKASIPRCYRCLQFGHFIRECKGEDRTNTCLKCGMEGHKVKECQGSTHCGRCNEGHREDSAQCPYYRKLLNERTKTFRQDKTQAPIRNKKN